MRKGTGSNAAAHMKAAPDRAFAVIASVITGRTMNSQAASFLRTLRRRTIVLLTTSWESGARRLQRIGDSHEFDSSWLFEGGCGLKNGSTYEATSALSCRARRLARTGRRPSESDVAGSNPAAPATSYHTRNSIESVV